MSQPDEPRGPSPRDPDRGERPVLDAAPPPRRRGGTGFLAGILGGLLGTAALLGAGGWYAYERGPVRPALERFAATETAARNAETGIAEIGQQLQGVQASLDQLRASLEGTASRVEENASRLGALEQRVGAAEQAAADLRTNLDQAVTGFRAASEEVIRRLEAANARMVELERSAPADVVDKGTVEDLVRRQTNLEQSQARVEAALGRLEQLVAEGLEAANQQGAALQTIANAAQERVQAFSQELQSLGPLREQVRRQQEADAQLRSSIESVGQQVAALRQDFEQQLAQAAERLRALDQQRERGVGMALAADSLDTAIETGQPFAPTLDILRQLGEGDQVVQEVVATLEPRAAEGVPTATELARQLEEIEASLTESEGGEPQDWLARTRENLEGLVELHPVGADRPGREAVQQARQMLLLQDLEGAVRAVEPLAQQGNQEAQAWVAAARARLEARGTVDTLRQHAKTLLARQD